MNKNKILELTNAVYDETLDIYKMLHKIPEMGNKEYETTKVIKACLKSCEIEVESPLSTGAVGVLHGEVEDDFQIKNIALRADIDALPITEKTGVKFASQNEGMMHACGHDLHTAALLGAAKACAMIKNQICGNIKFIFQPDEEGDGGANRLIKSGVLNDVDYIYGMHIRPEIAAGTVAVKYGKSYSASDMFFITVEGVSCHGAEPKKGVSALLCAAKMAMAIDEIGRINSSKENPLIISLGSLDSGTATNIIPGQARLTGIIRTLGPEKRARVKKKLQAVCKEVAIGDGCGVIVEIKESYPGVVNHDQEVDFVKNVALELFSEETVIKLTEPTMATEDFGYYLEKVPGAFYHIGVGSDYPLHNEKMLPQETSLRSAIAMNIGLIAGRVGFPMNLW